MVCCPRQRRPESLSLFMFQKPKSAKRLYFDVIPRAVDDYWQFRERLIEGLGDAVEIGTQQFRVQHKSVQVGLGGPGHDVPRADQIVE